jgi:hypothetical protein
MGPQVLLLKFPLSSSPSPLPPLHIAATSPQSLRLLHWKWRSFGWSPWSRFKWQFI